MGSETNLSFLGSCIHSHVALEGQEVLAERDGEGTGGGDQVCAGTAQKPEGDR